MDGSDRICYGFFSFGAVLELNCANLKDIGLDGFDCLRHRAILWDEASASLVSISRKVFQHSLCTVELRHSPTGQHVSRYFLGNDCSVFTANKWYEDVEKLPAGDREWLNANMVPFDVEQALRENACQLERCTQISSAFEQERVAP